MHHAISGTNAATYKVMEPHWKSVVGPKIPRRAGRMVVGLVAVQKRHYASSRRKWRALSCENDNFQDSPLT